MIKTAFPFFILFYLSLIVCPAQNNSNGKEYSDGHGGKIFLPMGDISFADEVINFKRGTPHAIEAACDSMLAIGKPDFTGFSGNFLSLGCGGSLTLLFTDNAIVNISGPDLYVFEMGKYIEPTNLEISKDGKKWINVGKITGGTATVDIGDSVKAGEVFHYVKLTDLKSDCKGSWPGADIDAVAAIGSGRQITLRNEVLYQLNDFNLLANAKTELNKVIEQIQLQKPSQIVIEGHTDNSGKDDYNNTLSQKRAKSVADYLKKNPAIANIPFKLDGYGSRLPIASNDTKEGQAKNRRVNIILIP